MCIWQALPLSKLVKLREQRYHGSSFSTLNLTSLRLWCSFCYHDRYGALRFLVIRTNALHEGSPSLAIVGEQHWALTLHLNLTGNTACVWSKSRGHQSQLPHGAFAFIFSYLIPTYMPVQCQLCPDQKFSQTHPWFTKLGTSQSLPLHALFLLRPQRRRNGVPPREPPPGLPHLRSRWGMRSSRSVYAVRL